eukprot:TRINITY_DN16632_c0_g1_i1.p1 TRINITY_DN16632_c0_g1~~TRINITY_DN16632_c0_g1_i1.p1  ORF type:complete len:306 (+),score=76.81 TRINITY_DN16632_c0_g1_i1:122-1039(+)
MPQGREAFVLSDVELGNWCQVALRSVFHRGVLDDLRKTIVRDHIDGHVFAWMLRTGRMTSMNVKGIDGSKISKVREIFYADFPLAKPGAGHVMIYPHNSQDLAEIKHRVAQNSPPALVDGGSPAGVKNEVLALTNGTPEPTKEAAPMANGAVGGSYAGMMNGANGNVNGMPSLPLAGAKPFPNLGMDPRMPQTARGPGDAFNSRQGALSPTSGLTKDGLRVSLTSKQDVPMNMQQMQQMQMMQQMQLQQMQMMQMQQGAMGHTGGWSRQASGGAPMQRQTSGGGGRVTSAPAPGSAAAKKKAKGE